MNTATQKQLVTAASTKKAILRRSVRQGGSNKWKNGRYNCHLDTESALCAFYMSRRYYYTNQKWTGTRSWKGQTSPSERSD